MSKPAPELGLVISYDYLWQADESKGWQEGGEHRPCFVVANANGRVLLCGISRSPPFEPDDGIEVDEEHKRVLGLKSDRQWVHCNEANEIDWTDPEIRPTPDGGWEYGWAGDSFALAVKAKVLAFYAARTLKVVRRYTE